MSESQGRRLSIMILRNSSNWILPLSVLSISDMMWYVMFRCALYPKIRIAFIKSFGLRCPLPELSR